VAAVAKLSIVSIVNPVSIHASLIKLHSIVESAADNLHFLDFKHLLFDGLSKQTWDTLFCDCFCERLTLAGATYESIQWASRPILKELVIKEGSHKFNTERLFARFYLPYIFKDSGRMLYIDNDAVVTADLSSFLSFSMYVEDKEKDSGSSPSRSNTVNSRTNRSSRSSASGSKYVRAAVGLVYEKAIFNKFYMDVHFHRTHPLVLAAKERHGEKFYYNGGVMLVDTATWIARNLTQAAEALFIENDRLIRTSNGTAPLYDTAVGDQGVFYMMLEHVSYLEPRFNMRRHPVKSIQLLERNITGVVHFAGTDGGLEVLCKWPTKYPLFNTAAMPLYLTVYADLERVCAVSSRVQRLIDEGTFGKAHNIPDLSWCGPKAVEQLKDDIAQRNTHVVYNPGKSGSRFTWPPSAVLQVDQKP
jgi:lipopolysaccharide biosynthesis glycosyltransferase